VRLVNHEAWFEHPGELEPGRVRLYLKWGHYPKTDGKIDFSIIKRVAVDGKEAVVGTDKDSSSRGALFVEAEVGEGLHKAELEYDKGTFTKTVDGKWLPYPSSKVRELGYEPAQSFRIVGKAVTYFVSGEWEGVPEPTGGLELVPSVPLAKLCDDVEAVLLFEGEPLAGVEVTVSYPDAAEKLVTDSEGRIRFKARTRLAVLKAVVVDGGIRQVSTLTLVGA
jgi:uncharacterized GH25 family protein